MAVIMFIIGIGVILLNQHFQKNLSVQKLKQEELKSIHQNDLFLSSIHAQEEERKRIAQDIHDELGAVISIMRMHLVMLEQQSTEETLRAGLQNARQLSETAITSIRSISHQLMPPQLQSFGLIATLESVIRQINKTNQISIALNSAFSNTDLTWIINLALYRIVMELINNTIKHAEAKHVSIDFLLHGKYIRCNYADDGKGLPNEHSSKGLGHKSIEGRVSALGGTLDWGNSPAGGFYAIIQLPL